jgi:hypothetical protein
MHIPPYPEGISFAEAQGSAEPKRGLPWVSEHPSNYLEEVASLHFVGESAQMTNDACDRLRRARGVRADRSGEIST